MSRRIRIAAVLLPFALAAAPVGAIGQQQLKKAGTPQAAVTRPVTPIQLPVNRNGVQVPAPPKTLQLAKPPPLSETQRRKLITLRAWGLNTDARALQPSILLTPQQPYLASGGDLRVATNSGGSVNYAPSDGMPYGSVEITSNQGWFVSLRNLPARPRDWMLVECHVAKAEKYSFSSQYPAAPYPPRGSVFIVAYERAASADGIVSALFQPSSEAQRIIQISGFGRTPSWTFGGCEITPVNP